jgi:hypothetical protein
LQPKVHAANLVKYGLCAKVLSMNKAVFSMKTGFYRLAIPCAFFMEKLWVFIE